MTETIDSTRATENTHADEGNVLFTPAVQRVRRDESGAFRRFTARFLRRKSEWPQAVAAPSTWCRVRGRHELVHGALVGDFVHEPEGVTYRVLGMRVKRNLGESVDYDVARLPKDAVEMRGLVRERTHRSHCDFVLRVCTSEEPEDVRVFLQGLAAIELVQKSVPSAELKQHFPTFFGGGSFSKLFFKSYTEDLIAHVECVHLLHSPRPYYIVDRPGLTLEELLRGSYLGFLDLGSAASLAVGMIQGLRALHSLGLVHRCVASYTFALRPLANGLLPGGEVASRVVCTDLAFSCVWRSPRPLTQVSHFVGTLKYSSPNAMRCYQQFPVDDVVSAIYVFVELIHGRLPWRNVTKRADIITHKEQFQAHPPILVDNSEPRYRIPIDIRDLNLVFKMLADSSPFDGTLNYVYVCDVLRRVAEANKQPYTENYLVLSQAPNVPVPRPSVPVSAPAPAATPAPPKEMTADTGIDKTQTLGGAASQEKNAVEEEKKGVRKPSREQSRTPSAGKPAASKEKTGKASGKKSKAKSKMRSREDVRKRRTVSLERTQICSAERAGDSSTQSDTPPK